MSSFFFLFLNNAIYFRFGALTTFGKDMQLLLLNKVYVVNVLGKSSF